MQEVANTKTKKGKADTFSLVVIIVCIFTFLLNSFVVQMAKVNGASMEPTLQNNEVLIVSKISKLTKDFERGDIVIFKHNGRYLIKRLIALPNDTIQIIDNDIYVNDEKIQDYVDVEMNTYGILSEKVHLKNDEYFFMGDNRNNSLDSREFGIINETDIVGKIILSLYPLKTF